MVDLQDWKLVDDEQDVRGKPLSTASGEMLGTIKDMMVDTEDERVTSVLLEDGRSFPVEGLELRPDLVVTYDMPERPANLFDVRLLRIG
jgi:sporulation protein YlmC with PRC-barrel domain